MSKVAFLSSVLQTAALMGRDGRGMLILTGMPSTSPELEVRPNDNARDRSPRADVVDNARVAKI